MNLPTPECREDGCTNDADVRLLVRPTVRCFDCVDDDPDLPPASRYREALERARIA